jgi:anthranilate phosphoribosyltransferase
MDEALTDPAQLRFAEFVRTLGRGPGKSRALTRDEAREAFGMVLAGTADPHQVGAFLMLLRYRGEDAEEIAGLVEAARDAAGLGRRPQDPEVALDWPSYGAGRTRGAPWFLLSALALAVSGVTVLMHGSNEFSSGMDVGTALAALGLEPAAGLSQAATGIAGTGFAYLPLSAMSPRLDDVLGLRLLLGLRSPVNTAARLLNPLDAPASVDGVFHPPYIDLHLGVAEALGRERLVVIKGAGGEAERNPAKPAVARLWQAGTGRSEHDFPALIPATEDLRGIDADGFRAVWQDGSGPAAALATIRGTIALALLALGRAADVAEADGMAEGIWRRRFG